MARNEVDLAAAVFRGKLLGGAANVIMQLFHQPSAMA